MIFWDQASAKSTNAISKLSIWSLRLSFLSIHFILLYSVAQPLTHNQTLYTLLVNSAYSNQSLIHLSLSKSVKAFLVWILWSLFVIRFSSCHCFLRISIALAFALWIHNSGLLISSNLSSQSKANHCLNGSALGEGIDWISLRAHFVLVQLSFWRHHLVSTQRGVTICPHPLANSLSLLRIFLI